MASRSSTIPGTAVSLSIIVGALSGCTVGPDYQGPPDAAPMATKAGSFHHADLVSANAETPPARWWEGLGDPLLTQLVDKALQDSPTLQQAEARLKNARATANERRAGLFPQGSATGAAARARIPTGDLSALSGGGSGYFTNLYDAGFDASWEIDLFGGTRRGIESAVAQTEAQEARLADAQVQLAADVAQAYVNLRDVQHRLGLYRRSAELEQQTLDLTRQRRALGTASQADVERLDTQLQQTLASIPPLEAQADQYQDQLATLTGSEPGQLDAALSPTGMVPLPPRSVGIGDPAAMLRRRPDIRQAERQLAASNAQIGQAIAQYFPSVNLYGSIGFTGTDESHLFEGHSLTYYAAPVLSWNILDFGRTAARVDEAQAGYEAALAQYRGTVLSALQDAETALSRFGREREHVVRLTGAEAAATRASTLTQQRHQEGTASLIDVLDVERQRLQTEQDLAQAQAMLTNDYVSLQKALGLGWSAPGDAVEAASSSQTPQR